MNTDPLIHIFGEVLFDHFPDGSRVLGGAPFNVAWHTQAFGLAPRFISRIGDDKPGHEIAALMDTWGMSRAALQTDAQHPTGSVKVLIEDGEPHYEIVPDSAFDFIAADLIAEKPTQGILYHGSLALRNPVSRAALQTVKARHQGKTFVDVNLRPPWWDKKTVSALLHGADWVKLNEAELAQLGGSKLDGSKSADLKTAMQAFCGQFGLDTLVVTCGAKGAVACDKNQQFAVVKPAAITAVVDTVGAGDAFASVLLLGFSKRWPLATTLERAQAFASAMVGRRGATVADAGFYRGIGGRWQ